MNKQEAIEVLKERYLTCIGIGLDNHANRVNEAINMAIEALKAEPIRCGECENYIDRRCIEANHHVAAHENCMKVFGAKKGESYDKE